MNLQNEMAYRPSFFLAVIGKTTRMLILLLFFQVIYFNTPLLAGWKYEEIFLLVLTFLTVESIVISTFHRSLSYYLPDLLKKGEFDFLLIKPINTFFYTAFRIIDAMDLTSSLLIIYLWFYYFTHYHPQLTLLSVLVYLILILVSIIFILSLLTIIASTAFWTINATGLGRFFEDLVRVGRFPTDIFRGFFSFIFLYILPIGIIATAPTKALLGVNNWLYLGYAILFTGALFLISRKVWNYALKHYSSASS